MSSTASAATVSGTVSGPEGKPVVAALVSLIRRDGLYSETVYSHPDGTYQLRTALLGELTLRVRSPGYRDSSTPLKLKADTVHQSVKLVALVSAAELSASLTASSHFPRLSMLGDARAQKLFRNDCTGCHQLGNEFTRRARTPQGWQAILDVMLSNWEVEKAYKKQLVDKYAAMLGASFDGKPVSKREVHTYDPALAQAVVREWKLPGAVLPHDAEAYTRNGLFYVLDSGNDRIYVVDPQSNQIRTIEPARGEPQRPAVAGPAPSVTSSGSRAFHSLQEGVDGKYYMTACFGNQIAKFDPATQRYQAFDVPGGLCPHTARFDGRNHLWFTVAMSNQVGRFDPQTNAMTVIALPGRSNRPHFPRPFPYGLDVNPRDGGIWYAALTAHKIGRIDPSTLEVKEFDSPYIGPRRLRFAADGTLWIPEFGEGAIARLDTRTMRYELYALPTLTPDGVESPYALAVHPQTQEVWVTANLSDRAFRFLPKEKRFIAYPLPTRGTYLRDMIFAPDGSVCSANGPPLPAATLEGGMPSLICITGADKPTAPAAH